MPTKGTIKADYGWGRWRLEGGNQVYGMRDCGMAEQERAGHSRQKPGLHVNLERCRLEVHVMIRARSTCMNIYYPPVRNDWLKHGCG